MVEKSYRKPSSWQARCRRRPFPLRPSRTPTVPNVDSVPTGEDLPTTHRLPSPPPHSPKRSWTQAHDNDRDVTSHGQQQEAGSGTRELNHVASNARSLPITPLPSPPPEDLPSSSAACPPPLSPTVHPHSIGPALRNTTCEAHSAASLAPGTIVRAFLYGEPFTQARRLPEIANGTAWVECPRGTVCKKYRFMIVVQTFHQHCVAVPIFTFGGCGLKHCGSRADRAAFVSVWDHRQPRENLRQESDHPPLTTEWMAPGSLHLHSRAAAFFTFPVSKYYRHKLAIHGRLRSDSTARLLELYHQHVEPDGSAMPEGSVS